LSDPWRLGRRVALVIGTGRASTASARSSSHLRARTSGELAATEASAVRGVVIPLVADVAGEFQIARVVQEAASFGDLHTLVTAAGTNRTGRARHYPIIQTKCSTRPLVDVRARSPRSAA
jgi:NADP-dependent 3-hydroxy acid dehydrogenase YdfG